jgi:hypothetical protein
VPVLRAVQRRRWWATALVQAAQRLAHRQILRPALAAARPGGGADGLAAAPALTADPFREAPDAALPPPLRLLRRFPVLQGVPARAIAIGPLPEHAPAWARRPSLPAPAPEPTREPSGSGVRPT